MSGMVGPVGRGALLWLLAATSVATDGGAPDASVPAPAPEVADAGEPAPPQLFRFSADAAFPPRRSPWADERFSLSQLSPLFAGPLADAKAAFDAGLYPKTLELLAKAAPWLVVHRELAVPARYLRALALLRAGLQAEAAREFLALVELYPELRDRCRFSAAAALEESGHPREAAEAYARVAPASPLYREAILGKARALSAAGLLKAAIAALAPLRGNAAPASGSGRDLGAEALWASADLEERLGSVHDAARDYLAVWLRHPVYKAADDAKTHADALAAKLPPASKSKLAPTPAELVGRAEILLGAHRLAPAQAALTPIVQKLPFAKGVKGAKPPAVSELACRAHFDLGKVMRMQRKHGDAIATLKPTAERCEAYPELRVKALYILGSSASIVQPELGAKVYEQLATDYPKSSFADDALFYEADLEDTKLARPKDAAATLRRLVDAYPDGDFTVEAQFRLFWLARAEGKPEAGLPSLEAIEKQLEDQRTVMQLEPLLRARYWRAETLASLSDSAQREEGVAALTSLGLSAPFSYYGALALGRLPEGTEAPLPDPPATNGATTLHAGTLVADQNFRAGVELVRLGFAPAAMQELEAVDRKGLSGPTGSDEPLLLLALCLDAAGDHQIAHAIAKSTLRVPEGAVPSPDEQLLWRVAYPLAFRPEIERWAQAVRVPPDLMQALMREESALDPTVISGAGAIGLTQLMPSTASRMAHKLGLGKPTLSSLGEPGLNIRIGTAYVAELLKRFGGNPALALAAYNAGEAAVERWLSERGKEPLDSFVEQIPIAETRGYVKRVLGTYATYRYLYGKGGERLSRFDEKLAAAF